MNYDEYNEVINGEDTYKGIAEALHEDKGCLVGWTDQNGTHFDILFVLITRIEGSNIQGGIGWGDLFVSIMRKGAFGFEIKNTDTHPGYYDEKLGGIGSSAVEFAELVNGIKKELLKK